MKVQRRKFWYDLNTNANSVDLVNERETPMKTMGKHWVIINILLICFICCIVVKVSVPIDDPVLL